MSEDRVQRIAEKAFLGTEFLTWLWFRSQRDEGRFDLPEEAGGPCRVWIDDRLALDAWVAEGAQADTFKGGSPAGSPEAHAALRLGKKASEARLRIERGDQEWFCTLKGRTLDLSSIKLPAVLSKADDDRFYDRMNLLEALDDLITALYHQFLELRLAKGWAAELEEIRGWVGRPIDV